MKGFTKLLLCLFVSAVIFSGCSSDSGKIKMGLSLPTLREERWAKDKGKMLEEAKKLGITLKVQVSDNDAAKQVSQCENLIAQGIKILIVVPQDASSASVIVDKAHKAGIKVIAYDRMIMDCDLDLYVSFDNVKVGELQGKYITKAVPKGNYVVFMGAPTDNNARLFREGAMKYIKPLVDKGAIKIKMEQWIKDWQANEAQKLMEQALTANNNKIDAVLAPNDQTAGGCIQALAAQGLAGKVPVTGQDAELAAVIRIAEGTQSMTVFKDTRILGEKAVQAAFKMYNNEKPETNAKISNGKMKVPSILCEPLTVDKANLEEALVKTGYFKKNQIYR